MKTGQIVKGSLQALATQNGQTLAESFLGADAIVIIDVSGSMATIDEGQHERRFERACSELARLQETLPGKVAVVAFSSSVVFCPNGWPPFLQGGTDLAGALEFVHVADGTEMTFVVISDGQPDNADEALRVAHRFTSRIDTVFIGPEGGQGRSFLKRLAAASGGAFATSAGAVDLAGSVQKLLGVGA